MMFVQLSEIAKVRLGYKSLQNGFFYVNQATIDTYGIEPKYLTPILMLRDVDATTYSQKVSPARWLFNCKDKRSDLRGTGAIRYIEAMANRSATKKKQSGKSQTIREALESQSGGLWYSPKARPNCHRVWLRKAFSTTFSPFLFNTPVLVDQRCNSVSPRPGNDWKEVAAVLTTSLFAYSLEINGAAGMGAGALEAPTTKLRTYPVFDLAQLSTASRRHLVSLAEAVWADESPIDWAIAGTCPGARLRALDEWIIKMTGRDVKLSTVYSDINDVCQARILVANDKSKKTKKRQSDSIGSVAESIVSAVRPRIELRRFPDDFTVDAVCDIRFDIDRDTVTQINITHLFDQYDIEIITNKDTTVYEATHPRFVAEAIVRSILWGRSVFSVSSDRKAMEAAVKQFIAWVSEVERDISAAISDSSLGTGYEDILRRDVFQRLGILPLSGVKKLPSQITTSR
jgi:hypothetical protein